MKKYFIGFIVGLMAITTLTLAINYSDIDWYGIHKDREFKKAVIKIIENCEVNNKEISC